MPSSTLRHLGNQVGQPVMQPALRPGYRPNDVLISPLSWCAHGEEFAGMTASTYASATYPAASRVLGYRFEIADYFLVRKVWWQNGTTVGTDSADVGVYAENGTGNAAGTAPIVSAGPTLIAGANAVQEVDVTDTVLAPGRYWCAYTQGGVTATPMMNAAPVALVRAMGWAQQAGSGATLGSPFVFAAIAAVNVPLMGIAGRLQVA